MKAFLNKIEYCLCEGLITEDDLLAVIYRYKQRRDKNLIERIFEKFFPGLYPEVGQNEEI